MKTLQRSIQFAIFFLISVISHQIHGQSGDYDSLVRRIMALEMKSEKGPDYYEILSIRQDMDKFARQRDTGNAIMVGGVIMGAIGAITYTSSAPMGSNFLYALGAGAVVTGAIINFKASKHLRKKRY